VYIRFAREKSSVFTTPATPFTLGKAEVFWWSDQPRVALIGCGSLVYACLQAARLLERGQIGSVVVNCPTIKPLDEKKIAEVVKKCGAVVTVEEHQIAGGLGGAVAEALARHNPVPMEFIGMQDTFGESGIPYELAAHYGMDVSSIVQAVKKVLARI